MANIPVKEHGELQYIINDSRNYSDFKNETFSGYKRTDVKKELLLSIFDSKLENACYWSAELICSGNYMEIWEILIHYLSKYISNSNPKLSVYLYKRFQIFRNIMIQNTMTSDIDLRNNQTIRHLFTEIIVVFISNQKKNGRELLKINKEYEFDLTNMSDRLKADSNEYSNPILRKKDPKEIIIAINELVFNLTQSEEHDKNMMQACYWLEWIIEFDSICRRRKQKCVCDRRYDIPVEGKYQSDIIWIVWDAFEYIATNTYTNFILQVLDSIKQLFCIKFTSSCVKKRRHLLYFAISMICEPYRVDQKLIPDPGLLENTFVCLPSIYKKIKNNEKRPKTDYLFAGLEDQTNSEISKQKMEWMNAIDAFTF